MSTVHSQPPSGSAVGRLLQSAWRRYKWLVATAVLLGALLGYGWAARQPTFYEGVTRVLLVLGPDSPSRAGEAPQPPGDPAQYLRQQVQLMRSPVVLERAVKLSGSRISPKTLGQRLEVDAAQDADVITIRVLDSTATGAAQLANAVAAAYEDLLAPYFQQVVQGPPAVPNQPIPRRPGRPMAIGMLLGLLASAVLVWWLTRRQGAEGQVLDA
jgi:uncharacterized protein involved in exopolysaccharide biosynthesis